MKESRGIKILVVDDEAEIRELLLDFLESAGFEVAVAKSGNEALSQAKRFSPNLIMLDIILPDLDGVSVFETLRGEENMSKVPVVFFSALGPENIPPAFSRRVDRASYTMIRKPISTDLLMKEVNRLLNSSVH